MSRPIDESKTCALQLVCIEDQHRYIPVWEKLGPAISVRRDADRLQKAGIALARELDRIVFGEERAE